MSPKDKSNDGKSKPNDLLAQIKQGAQLKSKDARQSPDKKAIFEKNRIAFEKDPKVIDKFQSLQDAYGSSDDESEDFDSDESTAASSRPDSSYFSDDDELFKPKKQAEAKALTQHNNAKEQEQKAKEQKAQEQKKPSFNNNLLNRASKTISKSKVDETDEWAIDERKDRLKNVKQSLATSFRDPRIAAEKLAAKQRAEEERKQRVKESKSALEKSLFKPKNVAPDATKAKTAAADDDAGRKQRMQESKAALEKSLFKPKNVATDTTKAKTAVADDDAGRKQRMQESKAALENSFKPKNTATSSSKPIATTQAKPEFDSTLKEAKNKAMSQAAEIAKQKAVRNQTAVKNEEVQSKLKDTRNRTASQAAEQARQKFKAQEQEKTARTSKTEAMSVIRTLSDLGIRTTQVHAAAEDAIKIAQSITKAIKDPARNEKNLRKLESDAQEYVRKLESSLTDFRTFVQTPPNVKDTKWDKAIGVSSAVLITADQAIVLAKAEVKLINAAIARDLAIDSAKSAITVAKRQSDMAKIAREAAEVARNKLESREKGLTIQAQEQARRAAEAQEAARIAAEAAAQQAIDEARAREAEAARLLEAQRAAEQAAAAAQQNIARSLYGR